MKTQGCAADRPPVSRQAWLSLKWSYMMRAPMSTWMREATSLQPGGERHASNSSTHANATATHENLAQMRACRYGDARKIRFTRLGMNKNTPCTQRRDSSRKTSLQSTNGDRTVQNNIDAVHPASACASALSLSGLTIKRRRYHALQDGGSGRGEAPKPAILTAEEPGEIRASCITCARETHALVQLLSKKGATVKENLSPLAVRSMKSVTEDLS